MSSCGPSPPPSEPRNPCAGRGAHTRTRTAIRSPGSNAHARTLRPRWPLPTVRAVPSTFQTRTVASWHRRRAHHPHQAHTSGFAWRKPVSAAADIAVEPLSPLPLSLVHTHLRHAHDGTVVTDACVPHTHAVAPQNTGGTDGERRCAWRRYIDAASQGLGHGPHMDGAVVRGGAEGRPGLIEAHGKDDTLA